MIRSWKPVLFAFIGVVLLGCTTLKMGNLPEIALRSYTFPEVESQIELDKKPLVVFLYAPWCRYCKQMQQTTFQSATVIDQLNQHFYFIAFNGEEKERVLFRGNTFSFRPYGRQTGTHELALALGTIDGTLTYPTLVILNPEYEIIFQYNAFLDASQLHRILNAIQRSVE